VNYTWPVEAKDVPVEGINNAIQPRAGTPDDIRFQALPCGIAIRIPA
jgi:hypothetical protein